MRTGQTCWVLSHVGSWERRPWDPCLCLRNAVGWGQRADRMPQPYSRRGRGAGAAVPMGLSPGPSPLPSPLKVGQAGAEPGPGSRPARGSVRTPQPPAPPCPFLSLRMGRDCRGVARCSLRASLGSLCLLPRPAPSSGCPPLRAPGLGFAGLSLAAPRGLGGESAKQQSLPQSRTVLSKSSQDRDAFFSSDSAAREWERPEPKASGTVTKASGMRSRWAHKEKEGWRGATQGPARVLGGRGEGGRAARAEALLCAADELLETVPSCSRGGRGGGSAGLHGDRASSGQQLKRMC